MTDIVKQEWRDAFEDFEKNLKSGPLFASIDDFKKGHYYYGLSTTCDEKEIRILFSSIEDLRRWFFSLKEDYPRDSEHVLLVVKI